VSTNDAGIYRIKDGSVTHYSTKEGLPSDQVYCLIPAPGGSSWACTANGLAKLSGGKIETLHLGSRREPKPCARPVLRGRQAMDWQRRPAGIFRE